MELKDWKYIYTQKITTTIKGSNDDKIIFILTPRIQI